MYLHVMGEGRFRVRVRVRYRYRVRVRVRVGRRSITLSRARTSSPKVMLRRLSEEATDSSRSLSLRESSLSYDVVDDATPVIVAEFSDAGPCGPWLGLGLGLGSG